MRIPYRQHWLLRRMNRRLCRSDPHLAAMLAIFARLYAAEVIASQEQAIRPDARAWRGLVRLTKTVACAVVGLIACVRRICCPLLRASATICRRGRRLIRVVLASPSPVRPPMRHGDSGLSTRGGGQP